MGHAHLILVLWKHLPIYKILYVTWQTSQCNNCFKTIWRRSHPPIMQSCRKQVKALKRISKLLFPPFFVLWRQIITGSVKRRRKKGQLEHGQQAQLSLYFFSCHFAFVLCGSQAFAQSFGTEDHCVWEENIFFCQVTSTHIAFYHSSKRGGGYFFYTTTVCPFLKIPYSL